MSLAVVGTSFISPLGLTPSEHAFFVRAECGPAAPGAFMGAGGETLNVAYCPWLGAQMPLGERMRALAVRAALGVLPWREERASDAIALRLVVPRERAGWQAAGASAIGSAVADLLHPQDTRTLHGAAGVFAALAGAGEALARGYGAVVIVAVDSFIHPEALEAHFKEASTPWEANLPRPAEAAVAIVVAEERNARAARMDVAAVVKHSATAFAHYHDDDDALVDGMPFTGLLSQMPAAAPVASVFGQYGMGSLRTRSWNIAAARQSRRIAETCAMYTTEHEVGCLGAAAGAANLVFGISLYRHRAFFEAQPPAGPMLAWAISRDGTHGLAVVAPEEGLP